jgi:hypothetical protein
VVNALDYLRDSELTIFTNPVSLERDRVAWHSVSAQPHEKGRSLYPTIADYMNALAAGAYSAVLLDGSLIQVEYGVLGGEVVSHRLAYVPCPYIVDLDLLMSELPLAEVMEVYAVDLPASLAIRTPIRFDYDPEAAKPGHPAAHMTINSVHCRIACVAPLHVHRFLDFLFRHFYPVYRSDHQSFFDAGSRRHVGEKVIVDADRETPHIMWNARSDVA